MSERPKDSRPLIAHVLHRFDVGGLENGVVNLINRMPHDRYRHVVVALTEVGSIRQRVRRDDVRFVALNKPPGQGLKVAPEFMRILREQDVSIVHTRNLGTLEMQAAAAWAGVSVRVHGEHGWDTHDPDGRSLKYRLVRRMYRPFVHRYIALSRQLRDYLRAAIGVPERKIAQIYNGVDTAHFFPPSSGCAERNGLPWLDGPVWVVGTVGRLQPIKDQLTLARAFIRALELAPHARRSLRLAIVGDGPLREPIQALLHGAGIDGLAWMAGERSDVASLLRSFDTFALPSRAEGISNTILEAMATGLPIIATRVGGNPELLVDGVSGQLVPPEDVDALAAAILRDLDDSSAAQARGRAALDRVRRNFSLDAMVKAYCDVYDKQLERAGARQPLQQA